jgi:hypothetical protein
MTLKIERIKVLYRGEERELFPADLGWERLPESAEELKALVERQLDLPEGALKGYTASETEGRWVIVPAPVFG